MQFDKSDKTAVIVIDMQNDFVQSNGALSGEGTLEIIPNINQLLKQSRQNKIPIIYTKEIHRTDLSDFGIAHYFEPPSCLEGTAGAEIVNELTSEKGDLIVTKRRYDAFIGTELDLLLRSMEIKNLIVTGVVTDGCVLGTVQHARCLDYKIWLLSDCTAGTTRKKHDAALEVLETYCAKISNLNNIVELISS